MAQSPHQKTGLRTFLVAQKTAGLLQQDIANHIQKLQCRLMPNSNLQGGMTAFHTPQNLTEISFVGTYCDFVKIC